MIVRVTLETPLLDAAVRESSVGPYYIEQFDVCRDVPLRVAVRATDADPQAVEQALTADPSVEQVHPVRTDGGDPLYQVAADPGGTTPDAYHAAVEHGGVFLDGWRDERAIQLQWAFPDRQQVSAFRGACRDDGTSVTVRSIHDRYASARAHQYGVTDPQYEVLELAAQSGYFSIPRDASLADLAADLDVSSQAVSERLRRGLDSLVEHTLLDGE